MAFCWWVESWKSEGGLVCDDGIEEVVVVIVGSRLEILN